MERRQAHDKNVRWLWKEPQMQHNNTTWSTSRIEINEMNKNGVNFKERRKVDGGGRRAMKYCATPDSYFM
jgi:hypothetical protein